MTELEYLIGIRSALQVLSQTEDVLSLLIETDRRIMELQQ